jgi:hypothetical protein
LLNPLATEIKKVLQPVFDHVIESNRLGSGTKAANFSWYKVSGTTDPVANTEFSILHGLESAPTWLIPVMDLVSTGTTLVSLTVTRVDSVAFVAFVE